LILFSKVDDAGLRTFGNNYRGVCYRPDGIFVAQPTMSRHWREQIEQTGQSYRCNCWIT